MRGYLPAVRHEPPDSITFLPPCLRVVHFLAKLAVPLPRAS